MITACPSGESRLQFIKRTMCWLVMMGFGPGVSHMLDAQVVEGRVLDAGTDSAVAGVTLELVDPAERVVRRVVSADPHGGFTIVAPEPAQYALRGRHIGYATSTSGLFDLSTADTIRVEFRMSVEAIALPPLTVVGTSEPPMDPRLAGWGFYQRMRDYDGQGKARFFTTRELDESRATRTSDLLRDLSEFRLVDAGAFRLEVVTRRDNRRVPIFLNAAHVRVRRDEVMTLDEIIALGQIGALEVYWRDAPAQYGGGAAIVIWTR